MVIVKKGCLALPAVVAVAVLAACNVSSTSSGTTGGIDASFDGAADSSIDGGARCEHGRVIVMTDYMSTQIALSAVDGTTQSASFLSTASTKASGVAFALSGDVVVPTIAPASNRVVLVDRFGTNVITWAEPTTAKVLAQLPVGTGFESNPQDYVEVDDTRAYVSRWGANAAPDAHPFDHGSDVLVIDTKAPKILASIPMPSTNGLPPRPSGMVRVGATTIVLLENLSTDFKTQGDSVLVGIEHDAVAWQVEVSGLKGCGRPSLSPSGSTLALACGGQIDPNGGVVDPARSGIALFDVTSLPPKPGKRLAIVDQLGATTQDRVAFATETLLLGKTQTPIGAMTNNQAFALDIASGKATVLLTANPDTQGRGKGIVYGDVRCAPGCGDVCVMADADVGKLQRWSVVGGALKAMTPIAVDTVVGLPPSAIGGY